MRTRLARGQRVGNRYRLERELGHGPDGSTWEAVDERLDRPVALRMFDPGLDRKTIVKRAGLAASLTHPRVVRVFDTGEDGGRFFTVSELVPESLHAIRRPLPPDQALHVAIDIAEALRYAHDRGVVHGNLHEGNVLLSEGGAKVGDFALSEASAHADRDDDLRSFGALIGRAAQVPDPNAPAGLARVIEGLASGAYTTAADALSDLRALRPPPSQVKARGARRGWLVLALGLLLAIAAFGVMRLGERQPKQELIPGGRIEGTPLRIAGVDDFDPLGDGREGAATTGKVADGDPQTFWSTERYSGGPTFSGLKEGVGIIVDLGKTVDVDRAQVIFGAQGCSFELRHTDDRQAPLARWATAASVTNSPASAALRFDGAGARYWLVWITRLVQGSPGTGNGHGCAIRELDLFAA